jgi:Glycosyl hydrolases family 15
VELEQWIEVQARRAAAFMLRAISATQLVMERSGFGQRIRPHAGSVLASPVQAHYDPEPDYFFHWFRDSAIVIDALRVALLAGYTGSEAVTRFCEFLQFSAAGVRWLCISARARPAWQRTPRTAPVPAAGGRDRGIDRRLTARRCASERRRHA